MTDHEQLRFLLGYLEGLKTKEKIHPTDLGVVLDVIYNNSVFQELGGDGNEEVDDINEGDNHRESFGEFAGSYAQDVEGLSDDFINDVLEGDPDNYWNID